jgi:hypothetical protein
MLNDIRLLLTRNLTMTALTVCYGLAIWRFNEYGLGLFFLPFWVHLSSGLMTEGDLQLRLSNPVIWCWKLTGFVLLFFIITIFTIFWFNDSEVPKSSVSSGFNYLSVLMAILSIMSAYMLLILTAWAAAERLSWEDSYSSVINALINDRSSRKSCLFILLLGSGIQVSHLHYLEAVQMVLCCAWVLRYVMKTPPEPKKRLVTANNLS